MLGEVSATLAEHIGQPPMETIRVTIASVVHRIAEDPGRAKIAAERYVVDDAGLR